MELIFRFAAAQYAAAAHGAAASDLNSWSKLLIVSMLGKAGRQRAEKVWSQVRATSLYANLYD